MNINLSHLPDHVGLTPRIIKLSMEARGDFLLARFTEPTVRQKITLLINEHHYHTPPRSKLGDWVTLTPLPYSIGVGVFNYASWTPISQSFEQNEIIGW
ncbi:hypothetical protein CDAR_484921 [Caerostris darwini]|uniref:Uncharacterized protein n=1 Tax=Caerostris darwini TaxID=1538125 RepID=A0AAV4PA97_9ARAC|nr:hypothetical protein CDAR_484921 [Caerostris darwini]